MHRQRHIDRHKDRISSKIRGGYFDDFFWTYLTIFGHFWPFFNLVLQIKAERAIFFFAFFWLNLVKNTQDFGYFLPYLDILGHFWTFLDILGIF